MPSATAALPSSAAAELARADGRAGSEALWARVAARMAELLAALGLPRELVATTLVGPLRHLRDARESLHILHTADGLLAVQAPTAIHRDLAAACAGSTDAGNWLPELAGWARGRTAAAAEARLQEFGVPALAVAQALRPAPGASSPRRAATSPRGPLPHRVVELGGLWAAPLAAQLLRMLGCEAIKVEAPMRPDGARFGPAAHFAALNDGKRELRLDLRRDDDRARFLALLGPGVAVIENFSPRVLPNLGLAPERIAATGAVLVSLPASRERTELRALGSAIELAAGLWLPGDDGLPTCAPIPFTDALSGATAALAALRPGDPVRVVGQLEDVAGAL